MICVLFRCIISIEAESHSGDEIVQIIDKNIEQEGSRKRSLRYISCDWFPLRKNVVESNSLVTTKQIRLYKINGICVKPIIFKLCYKQIMGNRVEGLDKVDGYGNNTLSVISVILIRAIQQE